MAEFTPADQVLIAAAAALAVTPCASPDMVGRQVDILGEVLPATGGPGPLEGVAIWARRLARAARAADTRAYADAQWGLRRELSAFFDRRMATAYERWRGAEG